MRNFTKLTKKQCKNVSAGVNGGGIQGGDPQSANATKTESPEAQSQRRA